VLNLGHFGKYIRNARKILNFGVKEGWRSVVPIRWDMKYCRGSRRTGIFCVQ